MIVFLDFDGVVHPEELYKAADFFSRLHLIEEVLREFPNVEIVISSAWRLEYEKESDEFAVRQLREHFSSDIAQRVVGVTPQYKYLNEDEAPDGLSRFTRHWECEVWVRRHRPPGTRWMAMDDRAYLFRPFCENLMTFHRIQAFKQEHQELLRHYLVALSQGTRWPRY